MRTDTISVIKEIEENYNVDRIRYNSIPVWSFIRNDLFFVYENSLDEKEKAIVKEMAESKDAKSVFDKYKKLCEDKIKTSKDNFDNNGDAESSKQVSSILEQVSKKEYAKETAYDDICKLIELTEVFE